VNASRRELAAAASDRPRARLDRWLWAARFFKTRALASAAITGGKVVVNGARAKRAKLLAVGDGVRIRHGPFEYRVTVRGVSEQRRPAAEACLLYDEDPESQRLRERLAMQLRAAPALRFAGKGRPTKKDRRDIERLRGE
jgi:ribosome-associated heat shock protein Hsp15